MTLSDSKTKAGAAQASWALLPRWATDQDGWSRTIAGDVLKNRVQPSDLDIDRYQTLTVRDNRRGLTVFRIQRSLRWAEVRHSLILYATSQRQRWSSAFPHRPQFGTYLAARALERFLLN
jgi:hypothetical protein